MLEMLGFSISRKIDNKIYENNYDTENINYLEVTDNKPNFIKRIFNKILSFLKK